VAWGGQMAKQVNQQEIEKFKEQFSNIPRGKQKEAMQQFLSESGLSRATFFRRKRLIRTKGYELLKYVSFGGYRNILKKENSNCFFCGNHHTLIVHHRDFNEKNNDKLNLVILCDSCHRKLHTLANPRCKFRYLVMDDKYIVAFTAMLNAFNGDVQKEKESLNS